MYICLDKHVQRKEFQIGMESRNMYLEYNIKCVCVFFFGAILITVQQMVPFLVKFSAHLKNIYTKPKIVEPRIVVKKFIVGLVF